MNEQNDVRFIEMSGKTLLEIVLHDEHIPAELNDVGVEDQSIVRVNCQGDIELRRFDHWEVIGGLLGEFEDRVKVATGLDWA